MEESVDVVRMLSDKVASSPAPAGRAEVSGT